MVWKVIGRSDPGSVVVFGGDDLDKVSKLFSAVLDVDPVDINTSFTMRSTKFKLRNPANTFSYSFIHGAIVAARNITLPTCTTDDQLTFDIHPTTIYNKAFGLGTSIVDGQDIALGSTTGSKIGTATTQKLGFYNKAPVVQPTAVGTVDASTVDSTYGSQESTVINDLRTKLNSVVTKLQSLGVFA